MNVGIEEGPASIAAELDRMWGQLAPIGREPDGGYRRLAWTDVDLAMRGWFTDEASARGLDVREDRAGNLWAWWGDPAEGDAVATGSHLDSVPQGGAYDGPLGVVSGLLAVDLLRTRGVEPNRPVAVVAFGDEEGARFGVACAGSRLLTGRLDPEQALALTDDEGVSLAEALRAAGREPGRLGADPEVVGTLGRFVELHIEQGRTLSDLAARVGVGTAIHAHGRWRFDLEGRADHAGTTRLEDRDDPMIGHARLVLAARAAAERHGGVATVGRVKVEPNAVNAVPGRVRVWLDARGEHEDVVRAIVADVTEVIGREPVEESWTPRIDLDAGLTRRASETLGEAPLVTTGAGHDAGILALAGVPAAMLFVRNPTGVSHSPDEHAERDDRLAGVAALADVIRMLAGEGW